MKRIRFKNVLGVLLALAIVYTAVPFTGLVKLSYDAFAKDSNTKLSDNFISFTKKGQEVKISLKNTKKGVKIKWSTSNKTSIKIKVAKNKKSITATAVANGTGQIICKVGAKKLICIFNVDLQDNNAEFQGKNITIKLLYEDKNNTGVDEMGGFYYTITNNNKIPLKIGPSIQAVTESGDSAGGGTILYYVGVGETQLFYLPSYDKYMGKMSYDLSSTIMNTAKADDSLYSIKDSLNYSCKSIKQGDDCIEVEVKLNNLTSKTISTPNRDYFHMFFAFKDVDGNIIGIEESDLQWITLKPNEEKDITCRCEKLGQNPVSCDIYFQGYFYESLV